MMFFFSSKRRHTRYWRDWSSDVCSSDLASGAAITRYVVQGAGRTVQVGADQRSVNMTGLTNGETYRFEVHAVNAKGDGPSRTSNAVRPTAEVPDPPAAVEAQARPDGTVRVSWPAANG